MRRAASRRRQPAGQSGSPAMRSSWVPRYRNMRWRRRLYRPLPRRQRTSMLRPGILPNPSTKTSSAMSETDLLYLPATKAAALIRRRALSPVEYVETVLAAIERAQPHLNAFATITADGARRDARTAEDAVMRGAALGPLHGVPVNIKDQVATAGVRTAHGTAIHADNIPTKDDICVARLRAAGDIVVGKTTLPE